jgi:hypothetical protein
MLTFQVEWVFSSCMGNEILNIYTHRYFFGPIASLSPPRLGIGFDYLYSFWIVTIDTVVKIWSTKNQ